MRELRRVLRPGGTAAVLDFNHSDNPVVDALQVWGGFVCVGGVLCG